MIKALSAGNVGTLTCASPDGTFATLSHTASAPAGQSRSAMAAINEDNAVLEAGEDISIAPVKVYIWWKSFG